MNDDPQHIDPVLDPAARAYLFKLVERVVEQIRQENADLRALIANIHENTAPAARPLTRDQLAWKVQTIHTLTTPKAER